MLEQLVLVVLVGACLSLLVLVTNLLETVVV